MLLQIDNLTKTYPGSSEPALMEVNLRLDPGKILAIVGESGSGKSTLLKLICGLEEADSGKIRIGSQMVVNETKSMEPNARGVGLVFQDYALFPHLNAIENVGFGISNRSAHKSERVAEIMKDLGISNYASQLPGELSGGQQQRVAIARALIQSPNLLLLDEPFSNLDEVTRRGLITELKTYLTSAIKGIVFVTHNVEDALLFADDIAVLQNGRVIDFGDAEELFYRPKTKYTANLFGRANFVSQPSDLTGLGIADQQPEKTAMIRPDVLTAGPTGLPITIQSVIHGQGISYITGKSSFGTELTWIEKGWVSMKGSCNLTVKGVFQWL